MLIRSSLLALLLSATAAGAADWEGVYQGTLGKAKIIVQLVEELDDMEGITRREYSRYSYLPKARDLNLFMTGDGKALTFEESPQQPWEFKSPDAGEKKVTGRWSLSVKNGKASGTWMSPDGKKKLPIALTVVPELPQEAVNPDLNAMNETYNGLWLEAVTFADHSSAKTFGEVEVRFVKDSVFGIEFPVIGAFPDAARREDINAMLMKAHRARVSEYRDCKSSVPQDWLGENEGAEMAYEITHASPTLLSVTESGSVFCGGAHPNNYTTPITYDLTTAEQMGGGYNLDLSPRGFGRVLKLANKDERIAFERFALGRWSEAEAKDTTMEGVCKTGFIEESPEGEKMFSLSFDPRGLAVTRTDYPHVASVCLGTDFNPTIIPWADLKPWLKPGQTLLP